MRIRLGADPESRICASHALGTGPFAEAWTRYEVLA
jgi:hypothetical protein